MDKGPLGGIQDSSDSVLGSTLAGSTIYPVVTQQLLWIERAPPEDCVSNGEHLCLPSWDPKGSINFVFLHDL